MTPAPMPDLSLSAHVAGGAVLTVPLISTALRPHTLAFDSSSGKRHQRPHVTPSAPENSEEPRNG
jgi:hypothetical protein